MDQPCIKIKNLFLYNRREIRVDKVPIKSLLPNLCRNANIYNKSNKWSNYPNYSLKQNQNQDQMPRWKGFSSQWYRTLRTVVQLQLRVQKSQIRQPSLGSSLGTKMGLKMKPLEIMNVSPTRPTQVATTNWIYGTNQNQRNNQSVNQFSLLVSFTHSYLSSHWGSYVHPDKMGWDNGTSETPFQCDVTRCKALH